MPVQYWAGSNPNLVLPGEELDEVGRFTWMSWLAVISDVVSLRIRKAWLIFISLNCLCRWHAIQLSTKDRVNSATVRLMFLYGWEKWPLRIDVRRLWVYEYHCLRSTSKIWQDNISKSEVRCKVLGPRVQSLEEELGMNRLKCLVVHVCRTTALA